MKVYLKILSFLTPLIALAISFGLTTFILILIDRDPVETFTLMFDYGTTGKSIISILNRSIPLYISAVAVAVGFKMGMFNIGVEGQYILGALIAATIKIVRTCNGLGSINTAPTCAAINAPRIYWPSTPMLNIPILKPTATATAEI